MVILQKYQNKRNLMRSKHLSFRMGITLKRTLVIVTSLLLLLLAFSGCSNTENFEESHYYKGVTALEENGVGLDQLMTVDIPEQYRRESDDFVTNVDYIGDEDSFNLKILSYDGYPVYDYYNETTGTATLEDLLKGLSITEEKTMNGTTFYIDGSSPGTLRAIFKHDEYVLDIVRSTNSSKRNLSEEQKKEYIDILKTIKFY